MTGKWTPGGRTKTKEECPADELLFPYEYECVRETDVKEKKETVKLGATARFPEHRYIYFKYSSDEVNKALTPKAELDALGDLMAGGYKVVNVQAFTSPEGLRDPSAKWKEGNGALGMRRAEKARRRQALPRRQLHHRQHLRAEGRRAAPVDLENLDDGTTSRGQGRSRTTSSGWEETDPDVREQKTPAAEKRVAAARGRKAKAEVIYEYLRRSRIDLVRVESSHECEDITPAHDDQGQLPEGRARGSADRLASPAWSDPRPLP